MSRHSLEGFLAFAAIVTVGVTVALPSLGQEWRAGTEGGPQIPKTRGVSAAPPHWGTTDSIDLMIPASAFHPQSDITYSYFGFGYVYGTSGTGTERIWWAPLDLPNGAFLEGLTLYYYDNTPVTDLELYLTSYEGDTIPGTTDLFHTSSSDAPGYGTVYLPTNYTIDLRDDVTGEARFYQVIVWPGEQTSDNAFKGVRASYRLQVSPAPATPTFADVPASDPAFQFIEAMAASGITAGCNAAPPLYCPDNPVTRRQMAVFFAKALGLHWPF
jgi:hypothetical protein